MWLATSSGWVMNSALRSWSIVSSYGFLVVCFPVDILFVSFWFVFAILVMVLCHCCFANVGYALSICEISCSVALSMWISCLHVSFVVLPLSFMWPWQKEGRLYMVRLVLLSGLVFLLIFYLLVFGSCLRSLSWFFVVVVLQT